MTLSISIKYNYAESQVFVMMIVNMLSGIKLNVVMLNALLASVIMLNVVMLNVVVLNVIMQSIVAVSINDAFLSTTLTPS